MAVENPRRDQLGDHLITPQNAALVLIDYQPSQFATVRSMDADLLRKNVVSTVSAAKAFALARMAIEAEPSTTSYRMFCTGGLLATVKYRMVMKAPAPRYTSQARFQARSTW